VSLNVCSAPPSLSPYNLELTAKAPRLRSQYEGTLAHEGSSVQTVAAEAVNDATTSFVIVQVFGDVDTTGTQTSPAGQASEASQLTGTQVF